MTTGSLELKQNIKRSGY